MKDPREYGIFDVESSYVQKLEQQLADYKKRIDELEAPMSCDGCKYNSPPNLINYYCGQCIRGKRRDYYELKDKQ